MPFQKLDQLVFIMRLHAHIADENGVLPLGADESLNFDAEWVTISFAVGKSDPFPHWLGALGPGMDVQPMAVSGLDLHVLGDVVFRTGWKGGYQSDDCFLGDGVEC